MSAVFSVSRMSAEGVVLRVAAKLNIVRNFLAPLELPNVRSVIPAFRAKIVLRKRAVMPHFFRNSEGFRLSRFPPLRLIHCRRLLLVLLPIVKR